MYEGPKTSTRMFEIKCVGDSDAVANMLEDIAKKVRKGTIHHTEEMFYSMESHAYVKEENRPKKC